MLQVLNSFPRLEIALALAVACLRGRIVVCPNPIFTFFVALRN